MQFDSRAFFAFFPLVYAIYLLLGHRWRAQNTLLLLASYIFYAWWDWRFLSLILISTANDYIIGRQLGRLDPSAQSDARKTLLAVSVVVNLGVLAVFKYFNFFADSVTDLLTTIGFQVDPVVLSVVLPVGISFYTFQTLSYTIDIYRGELEPTDNLRDFALFVAFFPQLVAGPIERAKNLLPQISSPRRIDPAQVEAAIWLIVWGYFKKVIIADRLGLFVVNPIFGDLVSVSYAELVVGTVAFAFQIYCDFSAYSDIARGLARLLGVEIMVNFRLPYFALSPSDFWNRWHISLSTWLRDYLYIPLGGNRGSRLFTYRNLMITMLLGGLWHGAAWNFVIWGAYHGLILILFRHFERTPMHRDPWNGNYSAPVVLGRMVFMFTLTLIGWLFFRIPSSALPVLAAPHAIYRPDTLSHLQTMWPLILPLLTVQFWQYVTRDLLIPIKLPGLARGGVYGILVILTLFFSTQQPVEFIYFQF